MSVKKTAPSNIRILLEKIYSGHCQVCDFFFFKRNGKPYYEIHHINPALGHHLKNLVLVCANCHRQFSYSSVEHYFNHSKWLKRVRFNEREFSLTQIVFKQRITDVNKQIFI